MDWRKVTKRDREEAVEEFRKLAWIPTEADSSNRILSKVIKVAHSALENVGYLLNL